MKGTAFTILQPNQYYEYRCIDVSQYKQQGYSLDHIDENGCEIVKKKQINLNSRIEMGTQYCTCEAGCKTTRNICEETYGHLYTIISCEHYAYFTRAVAEVCYQYETVYKGGYEQVINTCQFEQNDLLVAESFSAEQTINKFSTRYPVKSFCRAHPAIFTDEDLRRSITSTEVYDTLINGEDFFIPSGQTLTLFYIMENNANLPTLCEGGESLALDVESGLCKSTIGFTYLCSEGQFDALTGTCVVQAESRILCDDLRARYDVQLEVCIYNPPVQADCGDDTCFYSVDRDVCICYPELEYECLGSFLFEEPTDKIECQSISGIWEECSQCPIDKFCPETVCRPKCNTGQLCVWKSPLIRECRNENATIRDGECVIEGERVVLCSDDSEYNEITRLCEKFPETRFVCESGVEPIIDQITGNKVCFSEIMEFIDCDIDMVYNVNTNECVPSIQVYDPVTKEVVEYREIYKGCESDSICKSLDKELKCDKDRGVCHTDVTFSDPGVSKFGVSKLIAISVIILSFLFIIMLTRQKKKR